MTWPIASVLIAFLCLVAVVAWHAVLLLHERKLCEGNSLTLMQGEVIAAQGDIDVIKGRIEQHERALDKLMELIDKANEAASQANAKATRTHDQLAAQTMARVR